LAAAPDMVPLPKLRDLTMCILPLPFFDEQLSQETPFVLTVELAHERFGRTRCLPQGGEHGADSRMDHVAVLDERQELGPGLFYVQEEGQKIPLCQSRRSVRRRGRRCGAGWTRDTRASGPGASELLRLDPELRRIHAELSCRLSRQRRGLLG